ncbi:FAD-dependent oxidoreductase [Sphingopyxis sp. 550A]
MALDYDVIVVGAGGAGMSAAIEARDAGARVLLVEAGERVGGSTALSGGIFYAAGTDAQAARGIHGDTADAMFHYIMAVNHWLAEPDLVRTLCDGSLATLEWLIKLGVQFPAEKLYASCESGVLRGHQAEGFGAEIAARLEAQLGDIELVTRTRVRSLLQCDAKVVRGIEVEGTPVTAGATIITSGSLARDRAMLQRYYPSAAAQASRAVPLSGLNSHGDGIRLGQQVGASIRNSDRGLVCTNPIYANDVEFTRPPWIVLVNREGRRFIDETKTYMGFNAVRMQTGGSAFGIFDETTRLAAAPFAGETFAAELRNESMTTERIALLADQGRILRRDTLADLAEACGIYNVEAFENSIAAFNEDVANGRDSRFFKPVEALRTIANPPFYSVEYVASVVALTFSGLRIDRDARVIAESERPVPGLFAAGDATGNVLSYQYAGGGTSIGNALVYGRIAGRNAAARAAQST